MTTLQRMTEADVDRVLAALKVAMLSAETVRVDGQAGVSERDNYHTGCVEAAPNGTYTYTFLINGGAYDGKGDPIR
jgi:hypothetical protein